MHMSLACELRIRTQYLSLALLTHLDNGESLIGFSGKSKFSDVVMAYQPSVSPDV